MAAPRLAPTKRRRIRALFLAVLVLLPVQYALTGLVAQVDQEPWPAIVMPAFQRVYDLGAPISFQHAHLAVACATGRADSLDVEVLFEGVPRSHMPSFTRAQLRPRSLSGTPATERIAQPEAAAWLARRIETYTGLVPPCRLDVVWSDLVLDPGAGRADLRVQPLDTLTVMLPAVPSAPTR